MHVGGKCRKWMDGHREPDRHIIMTLELDLKYIKQSHMQSCSSICQSV